MIDAIAQSTGTRRLAPGWVALVGSAVVGVGVAGLPVGAAAPLGLAAVILFILAATRAPSQRLVLAIGAFAFVAALLWAYGAWVSPLYGYEGFVNPSIPPVSLAVVTLAAVLPTTFLPVELRRPSDVVVWFLYLFGYLPAAVFPIYILGPDLGDVLPFTILLTIGFACMSLMGRIPRARFRWRGLSDRSFTRLMAALGLGALAYLLVFFGLPTQIPTFATVYDVRAGFGAAEGGVPGSGYVVTWAGNVIFPLLMAVGLARSRRALFVLGTLGGILIYAQGGAKAVLFNVLLVPLLYLAFRLFRERLGPMLMWAAVAILIGSVAATAITGSLWPLALYAVRLLALPGQLTADYLQFFTSNPTYELSQSFLRWFVQAPYPVDPPTLIGTVYFHTTVNANANMWADALANFGLAGVVPFSVVAGALWWLLDSVADDRDIRVIAPTLGIVGLSLANGALFTAILTYGVGLMIALIALMPSIRGSVPRAHLAERVGAGRALRPKTTKAFAPPDHTEVVAIDIAHDRHST